MYVFMKFRHFEKTNFFFGHMRKNKLEYLAVTGETVGKRTRGRRKTLFTDQLLKGTNCKNTVELLEKHQKQNSLLLTSLDTALEEEEGNKGRAPTLQSS